MPRRLPDAHRLLPPELRGATDEVARRAELVVAFAVFTGCMQLLAAVVSFAVRGPNPLAFVLAPAAISCLLAIPALWRDPRGPSAVVWLMVTLFVNNSAVAWLGYGFRSPTLHVFVLFPVVAIALAGRRLGVGFAALAVGELALLFALDRSGHAFPLAASGDGFHLFHFLVQAGNLVMLTAILSIYDTSWRRAREEAEKARAAVEAADRAKSEFLAHMSHELRTPLNAVLGYVELLAEDARDDQIEDLGRVRTAGKHLLDLVDQVLDLARIEAGRVELELVEVDLGPLVSAALDELRPLAEDGGNHFGPAPVARVVVHADTLRVRQVVLNLLSNACKFTRGGVVSVELGVDGPFARLRVTDTGVGMEPEELERCFRPFEQGEAGRGQGTGLGLPISRRLCEAMGGGLTASSTPGVGTTFEVRLPLRQGPQASASHVKDASTPGS